MTTQEVKFCTTRDGVRIAYAVIGSGPVLVKAPNWMTHLEYEWQSPVWKHWWQELARDNTVIRFDQRGSGLSDWIIPEASFESWVSDLEAVVDAAAVDRFSLLGISQEARSRSNTGPAPGEGQPPDSARCLRSRPPVPRTHGRRAQCADHADACRLGRENPAYRQMFTTQFMPGATPDQMNWFNELQRISCAADNAARVQEIGSNINVVDRLHRVSTPTLVIHSRTDPRVPFSEGRLLASLIPGAALVELDSPNHLTLADEPSWEKLVANIRHFIATGTPLPEPAAQAPVGLGGADDLTPRELEVLQLIAVGRTNKEIANELVISMNTVTNHVKNILGKTGSTNRTEAANYAFRRSIVSHELS